MPGSRLRVLLVEDDPHIIELLTAGLSSAGLECVSAPDGRVALDLLTRPEGPPVNGRKAEGRKPGGRHARGERASERAAASRPFDLILLDVVLPNVSGFELLAALRAAGSEVPAIFVTGHDSVEEKIRGLQLGADDYVVKPFRIDELLARIEAVQRRRHSLAAIEIGDLRIDPARRRIERAGRSVNLSPREFDILLTLARANGRTVARKALLETVWDERSEQGTNVLDVHLGRLRRKLDGRGPPAIETVRGQGYRLAIDGQKTSAP